MWNLNEKAMRVTFSLFDVDYTRFAKVFGATGTRYYFSVRAVTVNVSTIKWQGSLFEYDTDGNFDFLWLRDLISHIRWRWVSREK